MVSTSWSPFLPGPGLRVLYAAYVPDGELSCDLWEAEATPASLAASEDVWALAKISFCDLLCGPLPATQLGAALQAVIATVF